MSTGAAAQISLGGSARVFCVHDRRKKVVVTEEQVRLLGLEAGIVYDERRDRIHRCGCCLNLFVDPSDEALYCRACNRRPIHTPVEKLAAPIGPVDG